MAFFVLRRKLPAAKINSFTLENNNQTLLLQSPISIEGIGVGENQFRFLNATQNFINNKIDWSPKNASRLWSYNLHYFDYLREVKRSDKNKFVLMQSWIEKNSQNSQPGWEPFTASLRIVNWIFYLHDKKDVPEKIMESLYIQALWLEKNDERHILANHYFENLKALLFAGVYFEGDDALRWRTRAIKNLGVQLEEQVLEDGGHYERSPQYHCLMLENYLDIYNLAINNNEYFNNTFINQIQVVSEIGLNFLNDIVFPDQKIPLFNDSAFGVSPSVVELNMYANSLFGYIAPKKLLKPIEIIAKDDSGLYGLRTLKDMLIMDCGDIGPPYQPGHTHCDFLSYELMLAERRLIVDTGVCEYQPGDRRHYLRSTKAHNTVSIDTKEQSDIWGEFRVARRAKKEFGRIDLFDKTVEISGAYSGFFDNSWSSKPRFRHERQICVKLVKDAIDEFEVIDTLSSLYGQNEEHFVESYIHFHPDIELCDEQSGEIRLLCESKDIATLQVSSDCEYRLEKSIYCPEFGLVLENTCLVIACREVMPMSLRYTFKRSGL